MHEMTGPSAVAFPAQPARPEFSFPTTALSARNGGVVRGVVLVGGRGTRLAPLTDRTPKPLLEVGGVPLVEHAVARLSRVGITDVTLALAFRPDEFTAAYPAGEINGVRLRYAVEDEPLDTAGAIANAVRHSGIDDTFVVCNGDIIDSVDIAPLLAAHLAHDALATIELHTVDDPSRFGVVPCDAAGRVLRFVEKPPAGEAPCNDINAGTYVMEPASLAQVPLGVRVSVERETFPALAAEGRLYAFTFSGYWLDAGKIETFKQANVDMAAAHGGIHPTADVAADARISDSSIGAAVRVDPGAVVVSSVVSKGCVISSGARVVDSVLGPGCTVPLGAEVVGQIVA